MSGTGLNSHASYNLSPLGTTISFTSPCARVFPPEWRVECPSDHGRHECVLPCLLVLLSSPLLTLVLTAESTVLASLFVSRSRRGASENLFCAVSVRARPCLLYASVSRGKGRGAKKVRLSRELQTLLGSVCGDQFVTLGYFVRAIFEVGFRAVSSES